jgi:hypothetical protein
VLIAPSTEVAELARAYNSYAAAWWAEQDDDRPFEQVFEPLDTYLHLTVAWYDRLTATIDPAQLKEFHAALADRLAAIDPFDIQVGPAIVGLYAVEVYVVPSPQLAGLAARARATIRDVFGPDAAREPRPERPWRAHLSPLYCRTPVNTDGLCSRIAYTPAPGTGGLISPVTMRVGEVFVADQDTWGPDGLAWDQDSVRTVALADSAP